MSPRLTLLRSAANPCLPSTCSTVLQVSSGVSSMRQTPAAMLARETDRGRAMFLGMCAATTASPNFDKGHIEVNTCSAPAAPPGKPLLTPLATVRHMRAIGLSAVLLSLTDTSCSATALSTASMPSTIGSSFAKNCMLVAVASLRVAAPVNRKFNMQNSKDAQHQRSDMLKEPTYL
eukprot:21354-Heterococcus_DN1.PRE.2